MDDDSSLASEIEGKGDFGASDIDLLCWGMRRLHWIWYCWQCQFSWRSRAGLNHW